MQGRTLGQRPIPSLMEVCSKVHLEKGRLNAMNLMSVSATDFVAFSAKLSGSDNDKQNGK